MSTGMMWFICIWYFVVGLLAGAIPALMGGWAARRMNRDRV
jgi:hypothetical protein